MQIERLQRAADDAKQQLDSKENIVKELSRDGSKLDKERYIRLLTPGNHVVCFTCYRLGASKSKMWSLAACSINCPIPNIFDMLSCFAHINAAVVPSVFLATITKLDKLIAKPVSPGNPMQTCNMVLQYCVRD